MANDFCPRCGCYYGEGVYNCPECGYAVREPPKQEYVSGFSEMPSKKQVDLVSLIFKDKWFYVALIASAAICFSITYFWRFSFLFLCFPLFIPMRKYSISAGVFMGICLGSIIAISIKYYWFGTSPFVF
jgi:hypothetical protein